MSELGSFAEYTLSGDEVAELTEVVRRLRDATADPATSDFYDRYWYASEQLPAGLRRFIGDFRRLEQAPGVLVHGFPVDDAAIGPTPRHWEESVRAKTTLDQELYLGLCASLLGEAFAWATLQNGRIVQDLVPIAGDEERQSGYGSRTLLEFHNEDGFHPDRCDYLLLLGLRNHDLVPTIAASVRDIDLSAADREILSRTRYCVVPDDEHIRQLELRDPQHPALAKMYAMKHDPEPTAALFGDRLNPYVRVDRPFMRSLDGDTASEEALDRLMAELVRVQRDIVVGPGTLLVVDNYLAVHGRRPFTARYDGTDRWLKRLTVRRDLRRGLVTSAEGTHRVLI